MGEHFRRRLVLALGKGIARGQDVRLGDADGDTVDHRIVHGFLDRHAALALAGDRGRLGALGRSRRRGGRSRCRRSLGRLGCALGLCRAAGRQGRGGRKGCAQSQTRPALIGDIHVESFRMSLDSATPVRLK